MKKSITILYDIFKNKKNSICKNLTEYNSCINERVKLQSLFKQVMIDEFLKLGIKKYIFKFSLKSLYEGCYGIFKLDNKMYKFSLNLYEPNINVHAVETKGKYYFLGRSKNYVILKNELYNFCIRNLPKHSLYKTGDVVLYKKSNTINEYIITGVNFSRTPYYDLYGLSINDAIAFIPEKCLTLASKGV